MTAVTTKSTNGLATSLGSDDNPDVVSEQIVEGAPYSVEVTIRGTSAMLFHRWQDAAVAEKAAAAKGSRAKKTDNVESYLYRDEDKSICLPGEYLRQAIAGPQGAAKYRQDPRSSRKSALDLYKASVVSLTELAPITTATDEVAKTWDYLDSRRVTVQRAGITRVRPAFLAGWSATIVLSVLQPGYIPTPTLLEVLQDAGRFVGVGDFRPTHGRFAVENYRILAD
jgi:hypothetical protein